MRMGIALAAIVAGSLTATIGTTAGAATKKPAAKTPAKPSAKPATPAVTEANPCPTAKSTLVAAMKNGKWGDSIKVWEEPDETKQPKWTLGIGAESQNRLVFTVYGEQGDWLNTSVPVRPNGSAGWIKKADVTTYQNPFYIVIETAKKSLTVCNAGQVIQRERVGVGAPGKGLTPTGTFYTLDLIKPRGGANGPYGPFAFGLSGFSETIFSFGAGGDGRVGIHGTNQPNALGTAVSSGCIRVSNAGITKIAKTIFLGTPVRIS